MVALELAARELLSPAPRDTALGRTVELAFGLPEGHSTQAEEDDHNRFREAQARAGATALMGRSIANAYLHRQTGYHQWQAEYHAALKRKYAAAAAYSWLAVAPDAPPPK